MKKVICLLSFAALLVLAPRLFAADLNGTLSGTWKGTFDFQGTDVPITVQLAVNGSTVTGTVVHPDTPVTEIHDGKIDGDTVSFWINSDYQGTTYKLVFKGKQPTSDALNFNFGTDDGAWGTTANLKRAVDQTAKPVAVDATGTWKGAFDFQGHSVPLVFHLKVAAGVLTGTVEGLPAGVAEIKEGVVDGENIRFSLTTDYQGTPVKLVYKGKVAAAEIKFSFGTEDGSWGTDLVATKS